MFYTYMSTRTQCHCSTESDKIDKSAPRGSR